MQSSSNDPIRTLSEKRIKHSRVISVMEEFESLIYPESQDNILLICGPTGVGKTTLAKHMVTTALNRARPAAGALRGEIPAIYLKATVSGEKAFSWRLFYLRILEQLGDHLDSPKTLYGVDPQTGRVLRPVGFNGNSLAALRIAAERSLRERRVQFLVIDEAAHIIRQTRNAHGQHIQLDTLKSLADECGTQIVLVGSYDLHQLVSLSGQLARRTHVLHFERYRGDHQDDVRAFNSCVQKFETTLPDLWGGQLYRHAGDLFENTLGCVGTLSSVLIRSAKFVQAKGGQSIDALKRALLNEAQRKQILTEIVDGESEIGPSLVRDFAKVPLTRRNSNGSADA
ncbi:TPA: AAA family ATPase [Burkholderia cepacia]|uniref:AAA family ATPase n=1 Tax=Burkholderia cepacia TaxID=292 RepID=UPI001CF50AD3|nr:AAA family ATPase [Burkholderia cepacia]MCA8355901.1 TniB family NTP-binding protein [Burkholderia cepacia]HDR9757506.1 AAA family ATPase [Burkholderia cepacia ATCC 25416]HDV6369756.1 AAA family ATPase [Burkholderia cepacia]